MSDAGTQKEPSSARLVLTLGLAGLLSGLALVGAYELTRPAIAANKAQALRRAVFEVVPGSAAMQKLVREGDRWVVAAPEDRSDGVYAAYDEQGHLVGYAIVGEGAGFQDTIRLIYGFDPRERRIVGMEVLESRETPGLGDKIYKDPAFVEDFRALAVAPDVRLVKSGAKSAANEVDAITGATISSRAVVKIINHANEAWLEALPKPGAEPPLSKRKGGAGSPSSQ